MTTNGQAMVCKNSFAMGDNDEDDIDFVSENDLVHALMALIDCGAESEELEGVRCDTFSDVGLMTSNEGIVLTLANGDEFQLTVVKR